MRAPALITASLLAAVAACSGSTAGTPDAALARDLQLASTATLALAPSPTYPMALIETPPLAAPTPAPRPRAAVSGPRRVQSPRATAASAPDVEPVAESEGTAEVELSADDGVEAEAETELASGGVPLPRPVPVSVGLPPVGSDDDGGYVPGRGPVVIRGGDIDDCRIHDRRPRERPVYRPASPGVGSGRWPVASRPPEVRTGGTERERGGNGTVWGRAAGSSAGTERGGSRPAGNIWSRGRN